MNKVYGILLMFVAAIFAIIETEAFGSNLFPASLGELICDLTAFGMASFGLFLILKPEKIYKK